MTNTEARKLSWVPWPFTQTSYIPISRKNARLFFWLFRRHDRETAKKHFRLVRAWRKAIGTNQPSPEKDVK